MTKPMEINEEMLETVNGGTFLPNMFNEGIYNRYGIRTNYHWEPWKRDEFWLPNGEKVTDLEANEYIKKVDPDFYNCVKAMV